MEEIIGNSYIRLKSDETKIYKVLSVNKNAKLIDAKQQNGKREPLNLDDVEMANSDDIIRYDEGTIQY